MPLPGSGIVGVPGAPPIALLPASVEFVIVTDPCMVKIAPPIPAPPPALVAGLEPLSPLPKPAPPPPPVFCAPVPPMPQPKAEQANVPIALGPNAPPSPAKDSVPIPPPPGPATPSAITDDPPCAVLP